jgi:hypothetical protein
MTSILPTMGSVIPLRRGFRKHKNQITFSGRTMNEDQPLYIPHGGYRQLRSYRVAEAIYDATVVFCRRFYPHDYRMRDQMVQAARSGVRNISEGSGMAATSRKSEMFLTNVTRASLNDELLPDYESFLRQRGLRVWPKDSREGLAMRERLQMDHAQGVPPLRSGCLRLTGLAGLADYVGKATPECAANAMICAIHQGSVFITAAAGESWANICQGGRIFGEAGGGEEGSEAEESGKRAVGQVGLVGPAGPAGLIGQVGQAGLLGPD